MIPKDADAEILYPTEIKASSEIAYPVLVHV